MKGHTPVLIVEVLDSLNLAPGTRILDCTVGLGGHAKAILERTSPNGTLCGFDRDMRNLELARVTLAAFGDRVSLIHDSFANIGAHSLPSMDGILFDLGFSSLHVDDASRGFSFQKDGPLDMRYDITQELTAETIVNSWSREDLADLFRILGEEPKANFIAKEILQSRRKERITTTLQLAEIIERVSPRRGKIHPATKVFQALRMEVNDELGQINYGLKASLELLKPRGRLAVITFHSLEDRLVKQFIKNNEQLSRVTKKPIRPTWEEQKSNARSRSAKLRVAEKIGGYEERDRKNKNSSSEAD
ncbi:MAG: 16S rRNA (cytosine(1402)-N(4))-methyltransferase RsmH [Patescibacteria group bacterium]|nr:16S rRNA (cytosine(1402)-N(4))-methyltransferase RsmH [Patescibacteria group bacterium]